MCRVLWVGLELQRSKTEPVSSRSLDPVRKVNGKPRGTTWVKKSTQELRQLRESYNPPGPQTFVEKVTLRWGSAWCIGTRLVGGESIPG